MAIDTLEARYEAFFADRCTAVTSDGTALASSIVNSGKAGDYLILPETISREPLRPFVRAGDEVWHDVVRWTFDAMGEAEERGIGRDRIDGKRQSADPAVRRLRGLVPCNGKSLGLDESWAYNVIKQVDNYGEIYDRDFGSSSAP